MNASMINLPALPAQDAALNTPRMSSREIAELTGKRHGDVIRDIRVMLDALQEDDADLRHVHHEVDERGYTARYLLPKDLTLTLVAGYNIALRRRIVNRWMELEYRAVPSVPRTLSEALRLAADQADQLERQQQALQAAAPKVEFVDRYATAHGSQGFRQVCKLLHANEARFRLFLIEQKIAYRLDGALTPYQNHIDAGRFEVKTGIAHASERAFAQMRFTTKGVTWVAGEWGKYLATQQQQEGAL